MSAQQITAAAVKAFRESLCGKDYATYVSDMKAKGYFWLAADTLEAESLCAYPFAN